MRGVGALTDDEGIRNPNRDYRGATSHLTSSFALEEGSRDSRRRRRALGISCCRRSGIITEPSNTVTA